MAFQHKQGSKEYQVTQRSFPQYSANEVVWLNAGEHFHCVNKKKTQKLVAGEEHPQLKKTSDY